MRQELVGGLDAAPVDEVDLPAADPREPLRLVEQRPAALELAAGTAGPVELEVGADPRQQLTGGERLDQVVVGAGVETLERAVLAGPRREHHHRDARRSAGRTAAPRAGRSRPSAASSRRSAPGRAGSRGPARGRRRRRRRSAPGSPARAARRRTPGCRRCRRRPGSAAGAGRSRAGAVGVVDGAGLAPVRGLGQEALGPPRRASPSRPSRLSRELLGRQVRGAERHAARVNVRALARRRCCADAEPPCSSTSSATSASPMPEPSWVRDRAPLTRWNRSNRCGTSARGDAGAGVGHRRARPPSPVSRTAGP